MFRRSCCAVIALGLGISGCSSAVAPRAERFPLDATLRVNDIQVIATHNSYHLRPPRTLPLGDVADYQHPALDQQLNNEGVRSFELDVFNGPSLPVAHTPVLDAATNCPTLAECLGVIRRWSATHPSHVPIFVLIEPKTQTIVFDAEYQPWDAAAIQRLDVTIRDVFRPRDLLTPDMVREKSRTLREAVTTRGWPTLGATRGRVALVLNAGGRERDLYLAGRPTLRGAPLFVTADPESPAAAVIKRDVPEEAEIRRLVRRGFIVRSRADDRGTEARANDFARANAAINGGAQIVTTDFPVPDPHFGTYEVRLPGGRPARCDPVTAPPQCRPTDIENPKFLSRGRG